MSPEIVKFLKVAFMAEEKEYDPEDVRRIRDYLELSPKKFGDMFHQSAEAVEAWESPEGSGKHRKVSGAAARVMQLVEWMALDKRKEKNDDLERALNTARYRGMAASLPNKGPHRDGPNASAPAASTATRRGSQHEK